MSRHYINRVLLVDAIEGAQIIYSFLTVSITQLKIIEYT
jgi:hypothetical protein